MRTSILKYTVIGIFGTSAHLSAVTVTLGDDDGFAFGGATADATTARSSFAAVLATENNNAILHGGVPLAFDQPGNNHIFGITFEGLSLLDPTQSVVLEIALKDWGDNDTLAFQYSGTTSSNFPTMLGGGGAVASLFSSDGTGTTSDALITLDLSNRTLGSTGLTVAESMAAEGYLDMIVQDDTTIDFVRLTYSTAPVPEPTTALLSLLGLGGLFIRRR